MVPHRGSTARNLVSGLRSIPDRAITQDEMSATSGDASELARTVLEEESRHHARQHERSAEVVLPDDLLPGVGGEEIPLREALQREGIRTVLIVGLLGFVGEFDNTAVSVLAPDIQKNLGISQGAVVVLGVMSTAMFLLGAAPISTLADRYPRKWVAVASVAFWTLVVFFTAFVRNGFQFFIARLAAGIGHSYQLPVNGPLLIDTYPIEARSRIFALTGALTMVGIAVAPVFAGSVASIGDGTDGWRLVFLMTAVLALPLVFASLTLREPKRGRHEMQAVLGTEIESVGTELPISLSVAFERLRKIRSFSYFLTGMAALGFGLISSGYFVNFYFDKELGLDALERGLVGSLTFIPALFVIPIVGARADARFRKSPPAAMVLVGVLIAGFGAVFTLGLWMPTLWLIVPLLGAANAMSRAAFAILPAVISTIIPYRLRSRGSALVGVYILLVGGLGGAILTSLFSNAWGERPALTAMLLPSTALGGALIAMGARHVRRDISLVVEELREEQEEHTRLKAPDAEVPMLQVRNLDFSYGMVQVLFDIEFEVRSGEVLALLGTNGAGKSTLLRAIAGLGVAERGVVRLEGHTITYADPEARARAGIVMVQGGSATFGALSVAENLAMACFRYPPRDADRRIERVLEQFAILAERRRDRANVLSGGQQQMLALAMALVHEPKVLLIDELSLGLAPVIVQELLAIVQQLRERGQTMLIVEQSINVALSIADRAVFLEKGEVRFVGPAEELRSRDDLARAVFLGREGG